MFYEESTKLVKDQLTKLIDNGQIEIVGGGWIQHDETLSTYKQQISNMNIGLDWLQATFP